MEPVYTDENTHIPIDYRGIRNGLAASIRSYPSLDQIPVFHEFSGEPSPEVLPCVIIFLTGRETPPEIQRVSAGLRTDHRLIFSVWVLAYSADTMEHAVDQRDILSAKLELALMRDRTLGGKLTKSLTIEAGLVDSGFDPERKGLFASAIETLVKCDVFTSL